ncbi:Agamous-like MADS-box protein AP1 [Linum perenne]
MKYNGEEIDFLNLRELQNLEQQLDSALKHVRSRKNQVIYESISKLQKKVRRSPSLLYIYAELQTRPCERKTTNWQRRRELNLELQSYVVVFLWVIESHIHGANYYHLQMQVKEREKDIVSQEAQLGQQQASTIVAQPFQHLDSR